MFSTVLALKHQRAAVVRHAATCGSRISRVSSRGYAAPAQPPMDGSTSKMDANMWKAYNAKIRDYVLGGGLAKNSAFYTAPMGQMGIPVGQNISTPITNMALYQIADTLLPANSPVFTPGTGSYIERQNRYLNAIELKTNTNQGALIRLQNADKAQTALQTKMDDLRTKARAAFAADTDKGNMPFSQWVSRNYPQYDSLNSELQQAANANATAMIEVYGPGAADLTRKRTYMAKALDYSDAAQGINMPVSEQLANLVDGTTVDPNAQLEYRPLYSISAGYADWVKQAMANSASNSGTASMKSIDINFDSLSNESWGKSGFSDTSVAVSGGDWFLSAQVSADHTAKSEHISAEQLGSGMSAVLRAVDISSFDVKAGGWDGDFETLYSPKDISSLANFTAPAAAAVSKVVMGYNVSLEINMSSSAAKQVSDMYEKATKVGGSISFFGCPIGLGAGGSHSESTAAKYSLSKNKNDFSSITIKGQDSGYPVLLGVVGRKLQPYPNAAH